MKDYQIHPGLPRPVEFVAAATGLAIVLPLLALAAVAVALGSPGPVLFVQPRVGRRGKKFGLYKLRTMHVGCGGPQLTARGDARVTRVGRVLRYSKIDELPQLWNVIKGDISLVGPRPEVPRYVDMAKPEWRKVLEVRPGITDPVTLRLRNEESMMAGVADDAEQFYLRTLQPLKLRGYLDYLSRRTWLTDLGVLAQTFVFVIWPIKTPLSVKIDDLATPPVKPHGKRIL